MARWQCSVASEQIVDVGDLASAELCAIGMCDDAACPFGVNYLRVDACSGAGCSAAVDVPSPPITCGGGCCC